MTTGLLSDVAELFAEQANLEFTVDKSLIVDMVDVELLACCNHSDDKAAELDSIKQS